MQCRYCEKEFKPRYQTDICPNCTRKKKQVRELVKIGQSIKEKCKKE
jgi:Zn finger protein HypA/HybF involved in hydrogenase expression